MADVAVVVGPVHGRDELVGRVLGVLVVLAELVAGVAAAVEEGDDDGVLELEADRVGAFDARARLRVEVIAQQRLATGAVDEDVSRLEHLHGVLRRERRRNALHPVRSARVDEIAERLLDGVERAEAERPFPQQRHQVGGDRLPEGEALLELLRIEERCDVVAVDGVGLVALERVRREVGREPDHARPGVFGPLLVEPDGEALQRLKQGGEKETNRPGADDVHADPDESDLVRLSVMRPLIYLLHFL